MRAGGHWVERRSLEYLILSTKAPAGHSLRLKPICHVEGGVLCSVLADDGQGVVQLISLESHRPDFNSVVWKGHFRCLNTVLHTCWKDRCWPGFFQSHVGPSVYRRGTRSSPNLSDSKVVPATISIFHANCTSRPISP